MAWRNLPELAGLLSHYYHAGQVDKAGKKYWKHPKRVTKIVREFPGYAQLKNKGIAFNFDKYPGSLRQLSLTPAEEEWFESVR